MATSSQSINFVNQTKIDVSRIRGKTQEAQSVALLTSQQVTAHGGGQVIVDAISVGDWDSNFPNFTKAQFVDALANLASVSDLLGSHGDLKPNLYRLLD